MFRASLLLVVLMLGILLIARSTVRAPDSIETRVPAPASDCDRYRWINPTPDFSDPDRCGNCHRAIYEEWRQDGHASSITDAHFLSLYDGSDTKGQRNPGWNLLSDRPDGAAVCASCHAPTAFDDPEFDFDLRTLVHQGALSGIHCDFCHKVVGDGPGEFGLTHGRYQLTLLRPDPEAPTNQLILGPIRNPVREENRFSPFYEDSRYCAACHEGVVFGVHAYSTYSEWLLSPANSQGIQCQDCHMKPNREDRVIMGTGGIPRDPATLSSHHFFPRGQRKMLQGCLRLELAIQRRGDIRAEVTIEASGVGHRVPTGLPQRQVILLVEAWDQHHHPINSISGPRLPDSVGPDWAGTSGRLFAKQLRNFDGDSPVPFWNAAPDFDDTRLMPHQAERVSFAFPDDVHRIRAKLIYRPFWAEVRQRKGWPNEDFLIHERVWEDRRSLP